MVRLRVRAQDRGAQPKETGVVVEIHIQKQMNSFPQWLEDYSARPILLTENAQRDHVVMRLKAISQNLDSPYVNYVIQVRLCQADFSDCVFLFSVCQFFY